MTSPAAGPVPAGGPMLPRPFRVRRKRRETGDTWTLDLEPAEGPPLACAPGQFTMVYAFGVGEVPLSVSGDPSRPGLLTHTVRAVGEVTRAICAARAGEVLGVRGPFGNGWPVDEAEGRDVLLVAGGLGLAPLRPAARHLLARRGRYGRVTLLCGARTPADLLYARELERLRGRFDLEVEVTVDTAPPSWRGDVGVVTTLIPRAPFDPAQTTAMVCGPEVMMRFTVAALRERGVPPERIHLSLERNMVCAIGFCGHCQLGPAFVCRDGPVVRYSRMEPFLTLREV